MDPFWTHSHLAALLNMFVFVFRHDFFLAAKRVRKPRAILAQASKNQLRVRSQERHVKLRHVLWAGAQIQRVR